MILERAARHVCAGGAVKGHLRGGELVVDALHEPGHVMVHVVEDHVDAALEVVALVRCITRADLRLWVCCRGEEA
jgi:hypothetical protein